MAYSTTQKKNYVTHVHIALYLAWGMADPIPWKMMVQFIPLLRKLTRHSLVYKTISDLEYRRPQQVRGSGTVYPTTWETQDSFLYV